MINILVAGIIALTSGGIDDHGALSEQSKLPRGQVAPPAIDYIPPPPTLKAFLQAVPFIIVGRVEVMGSPSLLPNQRIPTVVRFHTVRILETLKAGPIPSPELIRVRQFGGTLEVGGREVSTEYPVPLLETGSEAIFFLDPVPDGTSYDIAYGPAGLFPIHTHVDRRQPLAQRSVEIPPAARRVAEFSQRTAVPADEFLALLRALQLGEEK